MSLTTLENIPRARGDYAKPLQRCIAQTAFACDMDEFTVAHMVSQFLEAVAEEVTDGQVVVIPNFGAFGARVHEPKKPGKLPYTVPTFYASTNFNRTVSLEMSVDYAPVKKLERYRNTHGHWRSDPKSRKVRDAMKTYRETLTRQAMRRGVKINSMRA